jgi:hypothetical protein
MQVPKVTHWGMMYRGYLWGFGQQFSVLYRLVCKWKYVFFSIEPNGIMLSLYWYGYTAEALEDVVCWLLVQAAVFCGKLFTFCVRRCVCVCGLDILEVQYWKTLMIFQTSHLLLARFSLFSVSYQIVILHSLATILFVLGALQWKCYQYKGQQK